MLYFQADPRDGGGRNGHACNTCCCQPVHLRPGETNRMVIDYAAWALPLGWVVPTPQFTVDTDDSSCDTSTVDGFGPPQNTNYALTTAANTALDLDLSTNEQPVGNTFTYSLVSLSGPLNGILEQLGTAGSPTFRYTPNNSFQGFDYFDYAMEDAQGRVTVHTVQVSVGSHTDRADSSRMSSAPYVDRQAIKVDDRLMQVSFPIHMPTSVEDCQSFRLTIKQPAKDCDGNLYYHISCFDISPKKC